MPVSLGMISVVQFSAKRFCTGRTIVVKYKKGVAMVLSSVEEYINQFDGEVKVRLLQMREIITTESPEAIEALSYGLVGYKRNSKPLVYFGGFKTHIGFYATPNGHMAFADDFSKYKQGKGSVQFPLSEPLPVDLIKRVVAYRNEQTNMKGAM